MAAKRIDADQLLNLDQALKRSREEMRKDYRQYVNSGLATLMRLLDFDKIYVKARGVHLWDREGKKYLDFLGGYGALNLGHNHPRLYQALEQVREVPNLLQSAPNPILSTAARNLSLVAPGDLQKSFFCNSGAEAVEGALKLARIATNKPGILYTLGGFHGKSLGALSVTGKNKYQQPFRPLLPETYPIPYGQLAPLEELLEKEEIGAFILEPIQGEGGVIIPPEGYLKEVQELCRKHQVLLILDEIQTGLGRTGTLFACEREGVEPDILCLSKSLGGGMIPVGALITTDRIWKQAYGSLDNCLLHTSTFGGNSLAATAALVSIQLTVEEDLPARAEEMGSYLIERLKLLAAESELIKEVRGRGLLIGIEFEEPTSGIMEKISRGLVNELSNEYLASMVAGELLQKHRIITAYTLNNPNVIRLEPPLILEQEHLDRVLVALEDILEQNRGVWSMALSSAKTAARSFLKRN